ncbi:fatty acyl-CoA reductase 1 [Monomorium pharaonis]|uniref:fatty acyl-CoA reductase 1 n=1 Tax=Monomorium pharaonis TaxID=307658 RepID=UPI00063ED96E|nr:fatty acyl-CoA reductase 1 [Monomorium pharaonis]
MERNTEDVYIPAFYASRSILITGGTGFIGKALIEKLLRSCPDVAEIFVLIRPKKGLNINDRLKKTLSNKLFDVLRSKQPSCFDKIIPITGNVAAENLGLIPSEQRMLIERVSIIFHIAASVRFDEGLKEAIFNNTRSTRNICILAQNMKNLVVLLHVSSTYTQIDKPIVQEILYPMEYDWQKMIKIAETIDDYSLKTLTAKCLETMPNTYIFSKRLAEQVISDYSKSLSCIIFRPSIVISSSQEPVEGWIDNFNGPVGMLIGGAKGILRVVLADKNIVADFMPVDAAVKALLIAAWKRGIRTEDKMIDVYNCSSNKIKAIDVGNIVRLGFNITKNFPFENIIWKPSTTITKSYSIYYTLVMLLHIFPALFLDAIMKLFGVRPILLNLQRKIYVTNSALSYFLLNEWTFYNEKLLSILDNLSADNKKEFEYPYKIIDVYDYFKSGVIGSKCYLLNEKIDQPALEAAKRHSKRMELADTIVKTLFVVMVLCILYYKNIFSYIINIF